ncbi:hypothetical protein FQN54_004485 [Arachnomyces sp. PD_36]|nr:hypothetical protein FQN54_004485 [Arachnomyces sp. PD_36]
MDVQLSIPLTPPEKSDSNISPEKFLYAPAVSSRLKRKIQSDNLPSKHLKLNPPPAKNEATMTDYMDRVLIHQPKLEVQIPYQPIREQAETSLTSLRNQIEELKAEMKVQHAETRCEIADMRCLNADMKSRLAETNCELITLQNSVSKLYIGNLLIEIARRLFPHENEAPVSRLQQLVSRLTDHQLSEAGIPKRYFKTLRNMSSFVKNRNTSAHDTSAEFAALLLGPNAKSQGLYNNWAEAFSVAYGLSVEEVADKAVPGLAPL